MEPPSSNSITVLNRSRRRIRPSKVRDAVAKTLNLHGCLDAQLEIVIGDDEFVRDLNQRFRGKDEATDVLTFPAPGIARVPRAPESLNNLKPLTEGSPEHAGRVRSQGGYLGEIAIAYPYAERQAEARGVATETELAYLAIHGTLHLLGYEDETEKGHAAMLEEMNRAGTAAGLPPDPEWWSVLHASPIKDRVGDAA